MRHIPDRDVVKGYDGIWRICDVIPPGSPASRLHTQRSISFYALRHDKGRFLATGSKFGNRHATSITLGNLSVVSGAKQGNAYVCATPQGRSSYERMN
jgi:hypothetical protein